MCAELNRGTATCQRTAHWDLLPHAHCVHSGTVGIEGKENLTVFRVTFSFIHQYWGEKKEEKKRNEKTLKPLVSS